MRGVLFSALLFLLSCGVANFSSPPTSEDPSEDQLRFMEIMDSSDHYNVKLQVAVEENGSLEEMNRSLDAIERNMRGARKLQPGANAKINDALDQEFDRFLATLNKLRDEDWTGQRMRHWRSLQAACSRCHDRFNK